MDIISYALSKKGMQQSVSDYLDEHLTNPTNPPLDTSLTIANAAADSKATGDKLSELKEGFNELPSIKDSDAGNVDLDVSDASGNVIVRFEGGHIKTKNFDSSNIEPGTKPDIGIDTATQDTDDDADLYISDHYGNALLRMSGGNIQTNKFNSDYGFVSHEFEYTNVAGSQTIERFLAKGTRIKVGMGSKESRVGNIANSKLTYTATKPDGSTITLGQDYGYNFAEFVMPDDVISVSVNYGSSLYGGNNTIFVFRLYVIPTFEKRCTNVIHVAQDGSKDFASLREALDSISDNTDENRYIVYVYPGAYNVMDYYTADEISADGFMGLWVGNGISLIGTGARDEVIIRGELDSEQYTQTKRNDISTLNVAGDVRIENMTIEAVNLRYAIHDDSGSMTHKVTTRHYINLALTGENLASGGGMERTYGAGGSNWKHVIAKDCDFGDCFALHNSPNMTHVYRADLENCTARRFNFTEYYSAVPTIVNLRNCKGTYLRQDQVDSTKAQSLFVHGEGTNGMMVDCPSGFIYDLGDCHTFFGVTIPSGRLVKTNGMTKPGIETTANIMDAYGVSIGNANGNTVVQTTGYVNSNVLGLSGLAVGDYLTIDSNGNVVSGGTANNAVAVVKMVNSYGTAFAKLLI